MEALVSCPLSHPYSLCPPACFDGRLTASLVTLVRLLARQPAREGRTALWRVSTAEVSAPAIGVNEDVAHDH